MRDSRAIYGAAGVGIVALAIGIYVYLLPASGPDNSANAQGHVQSLETSIEPLRSQADLQTCQVVITNVNNYLEGNKKTITAGYPAKAKAELEKLLALPESPFGKDHLDELHSTRLTGLDAHYLELCLLLRDAARALTPPTAKAPSNLERATLAFHWVMRQVNVQPSDVDPQSTKLSTAGAFFAPPELVLRFGLAAPVNPASGDRGPHFAQNRTGLQIGEVQALKRAAQLQPAVVFLLLLQQMGIDGCLIASPEGQKQRYWCCGVLDGTEIYLFDPRLAMPLPGPNGEAVATLRQLQDNPKSIGGLVRTSDSQYDLSKEDLENVALHVVAPLSALSARMSAFESTLAKNQIPVRLHVSLPDLIRRFKGVKGIHYEKVELARWSLGLQFHFYPKADGGIGNERLQNRLEAEAVPFDELRGELPREFIGDFGGVEAFDPTTNRVLMGLVQRFRDFAFKPEEPRDLVLRGQYAKADHALGQSLASLGYFRQRFSGANRQDLERSFIAWGRETRRLQARGATREEHVELTKRFGAAVETFYNGISAPHLQARVLYLSGLCHQEQGERKLFAWQEADADEKNATLQEVTSPWESAKIAWKRYEDDHSLRYLPVAARWHHARAHQVLSGLYDAAAMAETDAKVQADWKDKAKLARQVAVDYWRRLAKEHQGMLRLHCERQVHSLTQPKP